MNTLTMFVATDVKKGSLMPACVKKVVPSVKRRQQHRHVGMGQPLTVEDKVDTSELLPCLDEDTRHGTKADLVVGEPEAVEVRALAERELLLEVGLDVRELRLDLRVGRRETCETGKGLGRIDVLVLLHEPTR